MDPVGRGEEEKLGKKGGQIVIRTYHMRKETIFNKK